MTATPNTAALQSLLERVEADPTLAKNMSPCAFCGGDGELMDHDYPSFVVCSYCGAKGPNSGLEGLGPIPLWNMRALLSQAAPVTPEKDTENSP